jgi:hypothetical protein
VDTYAPERWPRLLSELHLPDGALDAMGVPVDDFVSCAVKGAAAAAAAVPVAAALVDALDRLFAIAAGVRDVRELALELSLDGPMSDLSSAAAAMTARADAYSMAAAAEGVARSVTAAAVPRWLPAALGEAGAAATFTRLSGGLLGLAAATQLLISGWGEVTNSSGANEDALQGGRNGRRASAIAVAAPRRELSFSGGLNQLQNNAALTRESPESSPAGGALAPPGLPGAGTLLATLSASQAALVAAPTVGARLAVAGGRSSRKAQEEYAVSAVERLQEKALLAILTVCSADCKRSP